MNSRVVFTGGLGAGKTSVIELLCHMGYSSAPEVGRKVIQTQMNVQGTALPWLDKEAFRNEMVLEEINNSKCYGDAEITLYDRSIIDSYGYSMLEQIPISGLLLSKCRELIYCRQVFIFPPWEEIYANYTERKQDYNEAVATYYEMVSAYTKFGYDLIEVPKTSVLERAQFILDILNNVYQE